jgi:hypothetical protein
MRGSTGGIGWLPVVGGLGLLLSSCVSQGSGPQGSGQDEQVSVERAKVTNAAAPAAEEVVVRSTGSGYEIEVVSPAGFVDGAFDPVLFVGSSQFRPGRASERYRDHGLVYQVSSAEFAALEDGSPIRIQYGPSERASRSFGNLQKGSVR